MTADEMITYISDTLNKTDNFRVWREQLGDYTMCNVEWADGKQNFVLTHSMSEDIKLINEEIGKVLWVYFSQYFRS